MSFKVIFEDDKGVEFDEFGNEFMQDINQSWAPPPDPFPMEVTTNTIPYGKNRPIEVENTQGTLIRLSNKKEKRSSMGYDDDQRYIFIKYTNGRPGAKVAVDGRVFSMEAQDAYHWWKVCRETGKVPYKLISKLGVL